MQPAVSDEASMPRRLVDFLYSHRALLIVLVLTLGLRIVWAIRWGTDPARLLEPDSQGYLESARALLWEGRFSISPSDSEPQFVRTPGYPLLLALAMALVGQSILAIGVLQAAVSAVIALPTYVLGRRIFNHRAGLLAALLTGLDPQLLYYSSMMLTESAAALALTLVGLLAVFCVARDDAPWWMWSLFGVAIAAATMIRPTTYYLPLVLLLGLFLLKRTWVWSWRTTLRNVGLVLLPILVLIGGWQVRNLVAVESTRFSGIDALSMYEYRAAGVLAEREGRSWLDVREELRAAFGPRSESESQGSYFSRMSGEGFRIVRNDPYAAAVVTLRGFIYNTVGDPRDPSRFLGYVGLPDPPALQWLARLLIVGLWVLAFLGIYAARRSRKSFIGAVTLMVLTLYVLAVSSGPESYSRFRAAVTPMILVLVAGAIDQGVRRIRQHRSAIEKPVDAYVPPLDTSSAESNAGR